MTSRRAFRLGKAFAWAGLASVLGIALAGLLAVLNEFVPLPSLPPDPSDAVRVGQYHLPLVASITLLVSTFTAVIALVGTASTIILGWRADQRQSAEFKLKIEQLELELIEARQKNLPAFAP
jgi:hypothetical protein